jgi:electron transfer flavoprotein beta subunit
VNIIACVKQVPDTETQIRIAPDGKSIVTEGIKWVVNPYDEFGIEEALRTKEKFGGQVTVIGIGPKRVTEALRTALAMGADKAIFINDEGTEEKDSLTVARALATVIKDMDYDVIFTGQRGIDDDMAMINVALAEFLGIPHVTLALKLEWADDQKSVKVHRPIEGATMVVEAPLPVLITCQKGLNEPRYASLPGIMKAKKKPMDTKTLADLGIEVTNKLKVLQLSPPPERKPGKIIEGETPEQKAAELARLLHEEAKVI